MPGLTLNWLVALTVLQFLETHMTVKPIVHEIRIQNQVIFLDPPIEYARATWIKQLHDWIGERLVAVYILILMIESLQASYAGYGGFKVLVMKLACRCKRHQRRKRHIRHWLVVICLMSEDSID